MAANGSWVSYLPAYERIIHEGSVFVIALLVYKFILEDKYASSKDIHVIIVIS